MHIGAGFPFYKKAPSDEGELAAAVFLDRLRPPELLFRRPLYKLFLCVQTPNHLLLSS